MRCLGFSFIERVNGIKIGTSIIEVGKNTLCSALSDNVDWNWMDKDRHFRCCNSMQTHTFGRHLEGISSKGIFEERAPERDWNHWTVEEKIWDGRSDDEEKTRASRWFINGFLGWHLGAHAPHLNTSPSFVGPPLNSLSLPFSLRLKMFTNRRIYRFFIPQLTLAPQEPQFRG